MLVRLFIKPAHGAVSIGKLTGQVLEAFYAELEGRGRTPRRSIAVRHA